MIKYNPQEVLESAVERKEERNHMWLAVYVFIFTVLFQISLRKRAEPRLKKTAYKSHSFRGGGLQFIIHN